MQFDFSNLSQRELRIRRYWRNFFFAFHAAFFLILVIALSFYMSFECAPEHRSYLMVRASLFLALYLLPNYIFYRCAYKRAGTRLLTCFLYLFSGAIAAGALLFITSTFPYFLVTDAILISMYTTFYYLSWRLRSINDKLVHTAIYPEEYLDKTNQLQPLLEEEDLKALYRNLLDHWPQYKKRSSYLYQRARKQK